MFDAIGRGKVDAVLVPSSPRFYLEHRAIVEAVAKRRLPAMYEWGEIVRNGGLVGYGPDGGELIRRVATFVDRILKGARPGDLAVEQPTKFELVINLRTARALGLAIPQALLLQADEVIDR